MGIERRVIGLLLVDGFALMSFASTVEPLRAANLIAAKTLYEIRYFSEAGGQALSSSGAAITTEILPARPSGLDMLLVVAGGDPTHKRDHGAALAALRHAARAGIVIGGISAGPYLLASGGLLDRHRFTIHWEHAAALSERFPALKPLQVRFVIDGGRITCGGGIAPLDLMHALIESHHGADLAQRVSDWYLHTHVDASAGPQQGSVAARYQVHHRVLVQVLEKMEASIEQPLTRAAMAAHAGISERHLDRLFANVLQSGFKAEYLRIRLEHAQQLLRQSPMAVSEIAFASGFSSPSQFSRAYRQHFNENPGKMRK